MKYDVLKKDNSLIFKIISIILVLGYIVFFIIQYITTNFDFNNNINKIVLLFSLIFILCLCLVTKKKISIFFSILSWILVIILIFPNIYKIIPNPIKSTEKNTLNKISCSGKTDTSDDTIIDIDYKNDKINKIIYTYTFDIDKKDGAQNLVNRFNNLYSDLINIYGEIEISDNVVVKITYKLENMDIDKIKEIDDNFTDSYKKFKKENLDSLTCKNRD